MGLIQCRDAVRGDVLGSWEHSHLPMRWREEVAVGWGANEERGHRGGSGRSLAEPCPVAARDRGRVTELQRRGPSTGATSLLGLVRGPDELVRAGCRV